MCIRSLVTALAVVTLARSVGARRERESARSRPDSDIATYISINPLGIPFDLFSAEVESGIAQGMTLGGVGLAHRRRRSAVLERRFQVSILSERGRAARRIDRRERGDTALQRHSRAGVRETLDTPTIGVIARLQLDARCAAPVRRRNGNRRQTHSRGLRGSGHAWDSIERSSPGGSQWASRSECERRNRAVVTAALCWARDPSVMLHAGMREWRNWQTHQT